MLTMLLKPEYVIEPRLAGLTAAARQERRPVAWPMP
jgi:hypothetical protein